MNDLELKTIPTVELINRIALASKEKEQDLINLYAYELARRIYVPNHTEPFEDILLKFGYKREKSK